MDTEPTAADSHATDRIVDLTPKALAKVRTSMAADKLEGQGLRLAVVKGGCSGYEYSIGFAPEPEEGDIAYEVDGLKVFVASDSLDKLAGTVLDYADGLYGAGLKFTNPHAAHSCGCGASFSTEDA